MKEKITKFVESINSKFPPKNDFSGRWSFSEGKKYFKILRQAGSSPSATISAYAFVDKETGDLFMAAGWNAPARHKRGNVLDASGLDACEEYGVRRLK